MCIFDVTYLSDCYNAVSVIVLSIGPVFKDSTIVFYISITTVCSVLGLIGFVISICFAFTVAAESGALAGLGAALILKLFAFEVYRQSSY